MSRHSFSSAGLNISAICIFGRDWPSASLAGLVPAEGFASPLTVRTPTEAAVTAEARRKFRRVSGEVEGFFIAVTIAIIRTRRREFLIGNTQLGLRSKQPTGP